MGVINSSLRKLTSESPRVPDSQASDSDSKSLEYMNRYANQYGKIGRWLNYFSLKFRCILLNLKSLHRYDWIALLDVDEVIVPRKLHTSWAEMMEEVKEHTYHHHIP